MVRWSCTAAAAIAVAVLPALAAEPGGSASPAPPTAQTFDQLDTNKDNLLSFSECFSNPKLGNNFSAIDSNADGQLSREEIRVAFNLATLPGPLPA